MQLERASRLTVEFDGVSWALCHERTPFIEMALTGISLTNLRNRDQSGKHQQPRCDCCHHVFSARQCEAGTAESYPLQRPVTDYRQHPGGT